MKLAIGCVGVVLVLIAVFAFRDPISTAAGTTGALFIVLSVFLRHVDAQGAAGTNDRPEVSPTKDYLPGVIEGGAADSHSDTSHHSGGQGHQ